MIRKTLATALAVLALAACANPYGDAVLATEISKDGTYVAGEDIRSGTWRFANALPHSDGKQCVWSVAKKSTDGKTVTVNSVADTDNAIQTMFVGRGETLTVARCEKGGWVTFDNLTGGK